MPSVLSVNKAKALIDTMLVTFTETDRDIKIQASRSPLGVMSLSPDVDCAVLLRP